MDSRLQQVIQAQQLVSVMNTTKWASCIEILKNMGEDGPRCAMHYLLDEHSPYQMAHISWDEVLQDATYIYWMDIDIRPFSEISKMFQESSIPYTQESEDVIRVWGYYGKDDRPHFL